MQFNFVIRTPKSKFLARFQNQCDLIFTHSQHSLISTQLNFWYFLQNVPGENYITIRVRFSEISIYLFSIQHSPYIPIIMSKQQKKNTHTLVMVISEHESGKVKKKNGEENSDSFVVPIHFKHKK